jgi:hypothetical protein
MLVIALRMDTDVDKFDFMQLLFGGINLFKKLGKR